MNAYAATTRKQWPHESKKESVVDARPQVAPGVRNADSRISYSKDLSEFTNQIVKEQTKTTPTSCKRMEFLRWQRIILAMPIGLSTLPTTFSQTVPTFVVSTTLIAASPFHNACYGDIANR